MIFFDSVEHLHHKCHKIIFNGGGSYFDSSDMIKKYKSTKSPKITQGQFFQYIYLLNWITEKLSGIQKEFQILNHL